MTPKLLRLLYISEFFVATVAIFTAWSEIGGQASLDSMPWGWKFGLGLGLAVAAVGYTASLTSEEWVWNKRSLRWLAIIAMVTLVMGVITYYYGLQASINDGSDEQDNTSLHSQILQPVRSVVPNGIFV
jgi:acyl-CoA synthetase (AMP-forming)/AMP-acid ligase II